MGSPVSVVVAEIVMQHVEERALATCRQTIPLWLRYVDDTFTTVHKHEIDAFNDHLNERNADIQFTKEIGENGKLPVIDNNDNNAQLIQGIKAVFKVLFMFLPLPVSGH